MLNAKDIFFSILCKKFLAEHEQGFTTQPDFTCAQFASPIYATQFRTADFRLEILTERKKITVTKKHPTIQVLNTGNNEKASKAEYQ